MCIWKVVSLCYCRGYDWSCSVVIFLLLISFILFIVKEAAQRILPNIQRKAPQNTVPIDYKATVGIVYLHWMKRCLAVHLSYNSEPTFTTAEGDINDSYLKPAHLHLSSVECIIWLIILMASLFSFYHTILSQNPSTCYRNNGVFNLKPVNLYISSNESLTLFYYALVFFSLLHLVLQIIFFLTVLEREVFYGCEIISN